MVGHPLRFEQRGTLGVRRRSRIGHRPSEPDIGWTLTPAERRLTHRNNSAGHRRSPGGLRRSGGDTLGHEGLYFPFGSRAAPASRTAGRTTEKADSIMLSQAIGGFLASAIGVALSPVPIIAVILMLGTPKARSNGTVFALGWVTGLGGRERDRLDRGRGSEQPQQ